MQCNAITMSVVGLIGQGAKKKNTQAKRGVRRFLVFRGVSEKRGEGLNLLGNAYEREQLETRERPKTGKLLNARTSRAHAKTRGRGRDSKRRD